MKRILKILTIIIVLGTLITTAYIIIMNLTTCVLLQRVPEDDLEDDYFEDPEIAKEFD